MVVSLGLDLPGLALVRPLERLRPPRVWDDGSPRTRGLSGPHEEARVHPLERALKGRSAHAADDRSRRRDARCHPNPSLTAAHQGVAVWLSKAATDEEAPVRMHRSEGASALLGMDRFVAGTHLDVAGKWWVIVETTADARLAQRR